MDIGEIQQALLRIKTPLFVESVYASTKSFNRFDNVGRDYTLRVMLAGVEPDLYKPGTRKTIANLPFDFPADEDALRSQVAAAIIMTTAHETLEQVSDGGQRVCSPHGFKGGSELDTFQWLTLLDTFHNVVRQYGTYMPVKG